MPNRITYLKKRHRLTYRQISDLREFDGTDISTHQEKNHVIREMAKIAELKRLVNFFNSKGINTISLKGPLLSHRLHQDYFVRYSKDIDFLIDEQQIHLAYEMLVAEGYTSTHFDFPKDDMKRKKILEMNNQIELFHPTKRVSVELHWTLISYPIIDSATLQQLINNHVEKYELFNQHTLVLSKAFEFVYLTIHGALHKWERLKWLHDIFAYSYQNIDWENVLKISQKLASEQLIYQALFLANRYWPVNPIVLEFFKEDINKLNGQIIDFPIYVINKKERIIGSDKLFRYLFYEIKYFYRINNSKAFTKYYFKKLILKEKHIESIHLPKRLFFMYYLINIFYKVKNIFLRDI